MKSACFALRIFYLTQKRSILVIKLRVTVNILGEYGAQNQSIKMYPTSLVNIIVLAMKGYNTIFFEDILILSLEIIILFF